MDEISVYFKNFDKNIWTEILVIPFYLFISFMEFNYEILIIYYLNPIYFLISDSLYYGLQSIVLVFIEFSKKNSLTVLADFFAFIGYSIYVEAIIFNFCGMNKDTKIHITNRGILESKNEDKNIEDENDEEDEEEEDHKNDE